MGPDIRELFRATNPDKTLFIGDREADQKYYIDFSSVRGGQIIEDLKNNIALLKIFGILGKGKSLRR